MRNIISFFLGILMTITTAPALADGSPGFYKLSNGLMVLIHKDQRFPLVSMRLYVHAGSAYETPHQAGISHLLEHMVFLGTERRASGETAKEIEALGGYLNAATSFDYTEYLVDLPARHWRTGLDVLKDMAFHARIKDEDLEAEKKVVIAELKRNEDNPARLIFNRLQSAALTGTPYAHPVIGYEEVIKAISRQDILDYIADLYQPQSMLLVVAGDVDEKALRAEIEKIYGPLINRKGHTLPESVNPEELPETGPQVIVQAGPWNKVYLGLAFPVAGERDFRSVRLDVLAGLIGGGNTSYLHRKYKYQLRLVDSISLGNYSFERIGLLYFSIVLDEDKFSAFWHEFTKDLAQLPQIRFTDEELNRVKLNLEDNLFRTKETLGGLADKLGHFAFFTQPGSGEENYLRQLRETNHENLRGLLDTLTASRFSAALLLPQAVKGITADSIKNTLAVNWPTAAAAKPSLTPAAAAKEEVLHLGRNRVLILRPDKTMPYISGSLMFNGGDALLDPDSQGLSALTAAVLTKGSEGRSATETEDYLEDRAAGLTATAGRQSFSLNFTSPSRFNQDIFHLLGETLRSPSFQPEEFDRGRQNLISAIKSGEDQPLGLAFRRLFPFLYGKHPYGFLSLGTAEKLRHFTVRDARAFWDKQRVLPWVLAICGDFDRESVIAAAEKLPIPTAPALQLPSPVLTKEKSLVLSLPQRQQSHILLAFPTAPIGDPDAPGLQLLQSVLSGMSGLLFSELRERQSLGYTVTAIPWVAQKAGLLFFYIGTEPDTVGQAKDGFIKIVEDLRKAPLPEEVLDRAKNTIRGEYYRSMQSLSARSSEAATLFALGLPLDTTQKQVEAAAAVTSGDLWRLTRKYLDLDQAYWIEVQP